MPWTVRGDVAHDGADSGAPVKVGGKASAAAPAAVANGDRVNFWADLVGRLGTFGFGGGMYCTRNYVTSADASGADADITAAPAAGKKVVVEELVIAVGANM